MSVFTGYFLYLRESFIITFPNIEKERLEGEAGLDLNQKNSSAIYPDTKVRIEKAQYSILHLQHLLYNRGELIINPDFQRNQVWNNKQSSELIESILMGIPIPMMYQLIKYNMKYLKKGSKLTILLFTIRKE
ncbi:hypothetical protein EZS27_008711 [termite gut metagenome]|uniref:GmrSD restriction endonucleases N-terminal domain-containing protein n=1 Tax=termite gut metagenome TaxID=433724 RepID=A0A5J4SBU0_9ZZZZ